MREKKERKLPALETGEGRRDMGQIFGGTVVELLCTLYDLKKNTFITTVLKNQLKVTILKKTE